MQISVQDLTASFQAHAGLAQDADEHNSSGCMTYRIGEHSIAGHLHKSLHSQLLQTRHRHGTVHVLGHQGHQGLRAMQLL
jgi:hypothetical protein